MEILYENLLLLTWQQVLMWAIGGLLIYLAIKKDMEPALLLPMGFGAILVNLPLSGAVDQVHGGVVEPGIIDVLFNGTIANELLPLLLFIGIGAMIDFGPLLSNPKMMLFGAAAQFGIFFTISMARLFTPLFEQFSGMPFTLQDAASIGIIGAADGPTAIFIANFFGTPYAGAIFVAAYSYMALVPIIQPPVIRAITTKKERMIRMQYAPSSVSKTTKILFPILITVVAGIVAPRSVSLVGFLMFGNLIRECGVLPTLCSTAQNDLANLITLLLGLTISFSMKAEQFIRWETFVIMCLGLVAFVLDSVVGILFVKVLNIFTPSDKINPMVGAAGISAFPMSSRVIEKLGQEADPQNHLLMHAIAANVSGQIASVVAGGVVLQYFANMG